MTTPLQCLVAFALWTLALVLVGVGPWRIGQVLMNKVRPNSFPSGQPHGPEWYQRLNRAHANAVENLPVFAALVIAGAGVLVAATGIGLAVASMPGETADAAAASAR